MPVVRLHGERHAVIEWEIWLPNGAVGGPSALTKVSDCPSLTSGGLRRLPAARRSPCLYPKFSIRTVLPGTATPGSAAALASLGAVPPWWLFSGRWPCVMRPLVGTAVVNGSAPPLPSTAM